VKPDDACGAITGTLSVRPFGPNDRAAWASFVQGCADATFFHRIEWRDILENIFEHRTHYLLAERDSEIVGVLPLAEVKSVLFGHSLASLPFAVYGGAAVVDERARAPLHVAAADLARRLGADHLELRNRVSYEPGWPQQDLFVTFRKSLAPDDDANMQSIPRKQRAMVRKGIQRGLASEIDVGIDRFFELYADNAHRHGTPPFAKRYFEALQRAFGDACEVMTVVTNEGRPVSSVLSFYFRDEVLPYYAGDVVDARELAANDFKYWELMRGACARGCRVFDYGRSKRAAGSFDFKKNWGFAPQSLHYEYKLLKGRGVPQNNPSNPKYRAAIGLWRRLPRRLVNAIGPSIVRNLG
jgi:FemAB-related protein (PEP-CTERM system-associated)